MEAKRGRPRVRRPEALAHDLRPQPSCGPELRHLLEEVVVRVEEEGEPLSERVGREPRGDRRFAVGDAVRERERELLRGARSGLADVVPGDGDRVPAGEPLLAVGEEIRGQPHGRTGRKDVVASGDVLLQHVVLHRALEALPVDALTLCHELVEKEEKGGGRVDRHRRGDLGEGNSLEQRLHVGDRVDRHSGPPDLALGQRDRPSRSRAASAGRRRRRARSGPDRGDSGSGRSSPRRSRSPRTGGSSTDGRDTWSALGPRVNGCSPGSSSGPGGRSSAV